MEQQASEYANLIAKAEGSEMFTAYAKDKREERRLKLEQMRLDVEERKRRLSSGGDSGRDGGADRTVAILLPNGQMIHAALGDADAIRASFTRGEREDRVAVLERELQAERDKYRESRWESAMKEMQRGHSEEIRALRGEIRAGTPTPAATDARRYGDKASMQMEAATTLIREVGDRIHESPRLGGKLGRVIEQAVESPEAQERVKAVLRAGVPGLEGELVEQSPEQMQQALDQLEAAERLARVSEDAPRRTIPGRPPTATEGAEIH
jgi:hypothetical protein